MKKITKQMCLAYTKSYYKTEVFAHLCVSLTTLAILWFITKSITVVIIAAMTLAVICIKLGIRIKNEISNIKVENFYLEEDVVTGFKKRTERSRFFTGKKYIYTFEKYGKHTIYISALPEIKIPLGKEKNISFSSIDKLSADSCDKGDLFYLLICEENEKKKIIQSFYKYHFDVQKEDFDYIDGKYYCKKI